LDVEVAAVRGLADGAVEIELLGRAGARKFAQPPQRNLDVAGAELDAVVEVLELALVPHFDGAEVPVLALADAHAFRVVAMGAERRRVASDRPFRPVLLASLAACKTVLEGFALAADGG